MTDQSAERVAVNPGVRTLLQNALRPLKGPPERSRQAPPQSMGAI
ncbi:MAG: hypothetical protein U5L00_10275 [Desulfovermiculus sp.]|nr:hypothetical protein [Desulfovermiculus sp.]